MISPNDTVASVAVLHLAVRAVWVAATSLPVPSRAPRAACPPTAAAKFAAVHSPVTLV